MISMFTGLTALEDIQQVYRQCWRRGLEILSAGGTATVTKTAIISLFEKAKEHSGGIGWDGMEFQTGGFHPHSRRRWQWSGLGAGNQRYGRFFALLPATSCTQGGALAINSGPKPVLRAWTNDV
jgi:hypothetical protein